MALEAFCKPVANFYFMINPIDGMSVDISDVGIIFDQKGSRKNKNKIISLRISCLHPFPVKMLCYSTCAHKRSKNIDPTMISSAQ